MIYLKNYKQYTINESWLSNKMNEWDNDIKNVMLSFIKPFKDLLGKIKDWKGENVHDMIKTDIKNSMDKSFSDLIKSIDKVENPETLIRLYDDIDQVIVQLNDLFNKELITESVESVNVGIKLVVSGILDKFKDKFREFKIEYIDKINNEQELDDKREASKKYFKNIYDKIKTEMKNVDTEQLFNKGELTIKNDSELNKKLDLKPEDKVRYLKANGEENIAIIANNQDNVNDDEVKLRSEDNKVIFIIDRSKIIKVI